MHPIDSTINKKSASPKFVSVQAGAKTMNPWNSQFTKCRNICDKRIVRVSSGSPYNCSSLATAVLSDYGEGSGPILLDNVTCTGQESSLLQCDHAGIGNHHCTRSREAKVICSPCKLLRNVTIEDVSWGECMPWWRAVCKSPCRHVKCVWLCQLAILYDNIMIYVIIRYMYVKSPTLLACIN